MRRFHLLLISSVVASFLFSGCQSAAIRKPSSALSEVPSVLSMPPLLTRYPALLADVDDLSDRVTLMEHYRTKKFHSFLPNNTSQALKKLKLQLQQKERDLELIRQDLETWARPLGVAVPVARVTEVGTVSGFTAEKLVIESLKNAPSALAFPSDLVREHRVELINSVPVPARSESPSSDNQVSYLDAELHCDAEFRLDQAWPEKDLKDVKTAKFKMANQHEVKFASVYFTPSPQLTQCDLMLSDPFSKEQAKIQLSRQDRLYGPELLRGLAQQGEICFLPAPQQAEGVQSLFLTDRFPYMSCPKEVEEITPLEDAVDGVIAKAEMLLGQKLPREAILNQDPYLPLDFSMAPKLDAILVSYLVFRADFYGTLLSRMLEWHAKQGTLVRIIASDVISLKKDKAMFKRLQEASPNIKVVLYRYKAPSRLAFGKKVAEFHRTMHVKMFATISAQDPALNAVVIGGRNIHDGFVFAETNDRSQWPDVVDYTNGDEKPCHWNDFEVKIRSKELVHALAGQYFGLFLQDAETRHVRKYSAHLRTAATIDPSFFTDGKPKVRHFMSVPYKDGMSLEKLYVQIIDSAQKALKLSTPYFNLTPPIADAIGRAAARGVAIELVTRIDLDGDTGDVVLSEVNKGSIDRFYKDIKVYEYMVPKTILHSKFALVDGQVALIGSVNLNQRSFYHDTENGLLISSSAFVASMERLYEKYKSQSRLVDHHLKLTFWKQAIVKAFQKEF